MEDATLPKKQINLLRGWPNPSLLPTSQIQAAANVVLSNSSISTPGLLYGPDPGYQPLRQSIAQWLHSFYRNPTLSKGDDRVNTDTSVPDAERICITGGASQNLACVLQVFTDPLFTKVWMVAPCYYLACRIFEDAGLRTRAVGEGQEGVDLDGLERALKQSEKDAVGEKVKLPRPGSKIYRHVIYCVPTFSNPSGKTMSLSCRIELVKLARRYDALIITDDVYDFLQWPTGTSTELSLINSTWQDRALLPRLVDIDKILDPIPNLNSFGNAISNGSFSKIAGPGVRTGWAESTRKFTYGLSQCGSSRSGGAPSQMTATIMNELLSSSSLQTHIENVLQPTYQRRYNLMVEAIKGELVPLGVTMANGKDGLFGGYFIWIELPVDAGLVTSRAKSEEELIVAPGKIFEVQGDDSVKFPCGLRLCFSSEPEGRLSEGVKRLARVVKEILREEKGGSGANPGTHDMGELQ